MKKPDPSRDGAQPPETHKCEQLLRAVVPAPNEICLGVHIERARAEARRWDAINRHHAAELRALADRVERWGFKGRRG